MLESKQSANIKKIKSSNNRSKQAWHLIDNNINKSPINKIILRKNSNGKDVQAPIEVANMFNNYFKDVTKTIPQFSNTTSLSPNHKTICLNSLSNNKIFFLSASNAKDIFDAIDL